MSDFLDFINSQVLLLDGAMGTQIQAVDLDVEVGDLDAQHRRQLVAVAPAMLGRGRARLRVEQTQARHREQAVVVAALAQLDQISAHPDLQPHVLLVVADVEHQVRRRSVEQLRHLRRLVHALAQHQTIRLAAHREGVAGGERALLAVLVQHPLAGRVLEQR